MKKIIFNLFVIYFFIIFSGLDIFWTYYPYDGFRVLQIILILICCFYLLINKENLFPIQISYPFLIITFLIFYSSYNAEYKIRALQEGCHFLGVLILLLCLIYLTRNMDKNKVLIISIFPILTLIFLPISLIDRMFFNNPYAVWTQSFVNIRMLDDALLPCFFLNWYFLNIYKKNKTIYMFLLFVLTLFILNFIFNGSRAIFLSIFLSSLVLYLINKNFFFTNIKSVLLTFFCALSIYLVYAFYQYDDQVTPVFRSDFSGRIQIWQKIVVAWYENSLFGIGGNHMLLYVENGVLHPHNFLLLLLSEFGLLVFIVLIYILIVFYLKVRGGSILYHQ